MLFTQGCNGKAFDKLGIDLEELSAADKTKLGVGGVKVKKVFDGEVANQTGINEGFIITKVGDKKVNSAIEFKKAIQDAKDAGEDGVLNFTVPAGDYTTVRFIIGVDSAKSAAPLATRTGTLLPSANPDMYFSDTKGYVFVNLEGSSPQAPLSGGARLFSYHIGGYGNTTTTPVLNNIVQLSLDAPTANGGLPAKVRKTKTPEYHLHVDFMSLFNGDDTGMNVIRPATTPTIGFDANSTKARTNYAGMITVEHVHNY